MELYLHLRHLPYFPYFTTSFFVCLDFVNSPTKTLENDTAITFDVIPALDLTLKRSGAQIVWSSTTQASLPAATQFTLSEAAGRITITLPANASDAKWKDQDGTEADTSNPMGGPTLSANGQTSWTLTVTGVQITEASTGLGLGVDLVAGAELTIGTKTYESTLPGSGTSTGDLAGTTTKITAKLTYVSRFEGWTLTITVEDGSI